MAPVWLAAIATAAADPRDVVKSGVRIAGNANRSEYYNQPLAVQLSNRSWIVVLTNADHTEGQPNQRVVYGRYLRTSELVANHRAGPEA